VEDVVIQVYFLQESTAAAAPTSESSAPAEEAPGKTESSDNGPKAAETPKNCGPKFSRDAIKQ